MRCSGKSSNKTVFFPASPIGYPCEPSRLESLLFAQDDRPHVFIFPSSWTSQGSAGFARTMFGRIMVNCGTACGSNFKAPSFASLILHPMREEDLSAAAMGSVNDNEEVDVDQQEIAMKLDSRVRAEVVQLRVLDR